MISHPFFERYRMLAFINSVKLTFDDGSTRFLSDEEREKVQSAFFVKEPSFKFEKIIKILYPKYKKDGSERFFNYKPEKTVSSCPVTHQLQKVLETDDLFAINGNEVCDSFHYKSKRSKAATLPEKGLMHSGCSRMMMLK